MLSAIPSINFNGKALLVLAIVLVLGIIFGEHRARRLALGAVIGFVIADKLGPNVYNYLANQSWGKSITLSLAQISLLVIFTFLMALGHNEEAGRGKISIKLIFLSLLTAVFELACIIGFLPVDQRTRLVTDYNIAALVYSLQYGWLLMTALWLVALNFWPKPDKKK